MAKIILKSPYLKPIAKGHVENYVKYIATRDGVVETKNPNWNLPATEKQTEMINTLISSYPDAKKTFEYEDYKSNKSIGNAHELINYILENYSIDRSKYINYIAERPRVQKISSHGLFNSDNKPISLSAVGKEIAETNSNVWTHIISLKREDAERLGYNDVESWKALLTKNANNIAKQMHIDPCNFRWYAAFHNEGHHPHVHMIAYSVEAHEAYLSPKGISNIKSALAKDIFRDEMMQTYIQKDNQREKIKSSTRGLINDIISKINTNVFDEPEIENLLITIADKLSRTSGKMQYGYLKADVKNLIDEVVNLLEKNEDISDIYELWYQKKIETIQIYTDNVPEKKPLSKEKDFKPIKNMIVQMAFEIKADLDIIDKLDFTETKESSKYDYFTELLKRFEKGDANAAYLLGRLYATEDSIIDYDLAKKYFLHAGQNGNSFGYYHLAKLYFYGTNDSDKDYSLAEHYLKLASDQGNPYAEQMLYNIQHHRITFAATSSLRLLHYMSNLIRKRMDDSQKPTGTDRKEREKTNEKKQAQGLRISM